MTGVHRTPPNRSTIRVAWVLSVVTLVVSLAIAGSRTSATAGRDTATPRPVASTDPQPYDTKPRPAERNLAAQKQPQVDIPRVGTGEFDVATGARDAIGTGRTIAYSVEVEEDISIDPDVFAQAVESTLGDARGWADQLGYQFERSTEPSRTRILLATPSTTDTLCAPLKTRGEVSCRNGSLVVINAIRWTRGADAYEDNIDGYRDYVINHEVGHSLGFGHEPCSGTGDKAPVMLQQTLGLDGCTANPWP